jgi:hypothetical protein
VAKIKTIDNLGVDVSRDYAAIESAKEFRESLLQGARDVPSKTQVSVTEAAYPNEIDDLFGLQLQNMPFASFSEPPGYSAYRRNIFSTQLAPSLGIAQRQQEQEEQVKDFEQPTSSYDEDDENQKKKKKHTKKEDRHFNKQKEILLEFLHTYNILNEDLKTILFKGINRFHRG